MSKFAGLPDIDDAPDVYETPDVPADSAYEHDDDSDSELHAPPMNTQRSNATDDIVGDRLEPNNARKRFKDARVHGEASAHATLAGLTGPHHLQDFSTDLQPKRRKQRPLYPAQLPESATYEYMPRGYSTEPDPPVASTSETPVQRLRRLRLEMEEVESQIEAERGQQGDVADPKVPTGALLAQLRYLRGDLTRLDGRAEEQERSQSSLLEPAARSHEQAGTAGPAPVFKSQGASADLDERIVKLEQFVGASEADRDESQMPQPLVSQLSKLEHQLQLLTQPRHLDTVARRVKTLVGDLERIHEARRKLGDTRPLNVALSSGITVVTPGADGEPTPTPRAAAAADDELPPDALQRIETLFALLPRLEPLLPLAPQLLTRLKTLAPLHETASDFASTLQTVQKDTNGLKDAERGLREALDGLAKSIEGNEAIVKGNLDALQQRVDGIAVRIQALQA